MKLHSTNYLNTLIEVSQDTKATYGTIPPHKNPKTIAEMQYELIVNNPYQYTSDDVLFQIFAHRNNLPESDYKQARETFFSKGQPCFRTSPLTKTYGFGIHNDANGKMAIYGMETAEYQKLLADIKIKKVKSMKASR
jgi:hypothetical protein